MRYDRDADKEIRGERDRMLKLDIEGGEQALFSAETEWIAKTEAICIELHDRIVKGCSDKFKEVTQGRQNLKMEGEKYLSLT